MKKIQMLMMYNTINIILTIIKENKKSNNNLKFYYLIGSVKPCIIKKFSCRANYSSFIYYFI